MGDIFELMQMPADELLESMGIEWRSKEKGNVKWFNLASCPVCRHGKKDYECGISESVGGNGKLRHGYKCFHEQRTVPYEEVLQMMGKCTYEDVQLVQDVKEARKNGTGKNTKHLQPTTQNKPTTRDDSSKRNGNVLLNREYLMRMEKRLRDDQPALDYLLKRGLKLETVERFHLCLSFPYKSKKTGLVEDRWLQAPLKTRNGSYDVGYLKLQVPDVTQNVTAKAMFAHDPVTYYADAEGKQRNIFICEGCKDLWLIWQQLQGTKYEKSLLLITSTHGTVIPQEWNQLGFWEHWDTVYAGVDNDMPGNDYARNLSEFMGREAKRVLVPKRAGKDWTDFFAKGGTINDFEQLLRESRPVGEELNNNDDSKRPGRYAYQPIENVNMAFHNGHMYYITETLLREADPDGGDGAFLECRDTVIVRSDRTLLTIVRANARKNVPPEKRVLRLSDGLLIRGEPTPNPSSTWSWPSIKAFIDGNAKVRPLGEILEDVLTHLKAATWLPYEEDYALLALTVPVTYLQEAFDAVPLILLNGGADSGKTQMAIAMKNLCCNGVIVGRITPASLTRHVDETRGFIALDDLEAVGGGSTGDPNFNILVQSLKVSYKKESGTRSLTGWVTDKKLGVQSQNFYGVKLINNISGVDFTLGTRTLRIQTLKMPNRAVEEIWKNRRRKAESIALPAALRDEMHTWTFMHANVVHAAYKEKYPDPGHRSEEISASLWVMAGLVKSPELTANLEIALARQKVKQVDPYDPVQVLKEAVKNLIGSGFTWVAIQHIVNEIRSTMEPFQGQDFVNQVPLWAKPEWVGREIRTLGMVEEGQETRKYLWGKKLRVIKFKESLIQETLAQLQNGGSAVTSRGPEEFCLMCSGCPYQTCGCELQEHRKRVEASNRG